MMLPLTLLLTLTLATPLWAAPRLQLRWQQPGPVLPTATLVWKGTADPVACWVLIKIVPNDPPRRYWTDTAVLSGQHACYQVQAMGEGLLLSGMSNTACGIVP